MERKRCEVVPCMDRFTCLNSWHNSYLISQTAILLQQTSLFEEQHSDFHHQHCHCPTVRMTWGWCASSGRMGQWGGDIYVACILPYQLVDLLCCSASDACSVCRYSKTSFWRTMGGGGRIVVINADCLL